jgi:predicted glutamine amidotransferase
MCGIGGFSLASNSKVNARKLAHAMLAELETRGNQASGFAWSRGRESGIFKKDVPGSKLKTFGMPKRAQSVILHTRMATHGTIKDMRNNHPVISPDLNIALVHNGVIWNHNIVRKHVTGWLPEVDTSVIPATLEQNGLQGLEMIEGDAAIAWLDERAAGKLHVARIEHSPLVIANLMDGSFVFASTELILDKALKRMKLEYEWVMDLKEHTAITVVNGIITDWDTVPETNPIYEEPVYKKSYFDYRSVTNGSRALSKWDGYGDGIDICSPVDYDKWEQEEIDDWNYKNLKVGWNLVGRTWSYYDGYEITMQEEATHEDDIDYDEDKGFIKGFKDYLAAFRYDEETGFYHDSETGAVVGDEEQLYEDYEHWRYEAHWSSKARHTSLFEDWD